MYIANYSETIKDNKKRRDNMSLQHGDKLFVFYENDKLPRDKRYSYFGNNFGTVSGFSQYIDGYIFAVKALYNEFISCKNYRNDILDTLIYPMCFNYRHIIELYIKYLYFKYSETDDADKSRFVSQVSHKLNKAWIEAKPLLMPLLSKIGSSIDITLFDEFINEIDDFDTDSFRMRYPIKKDLTYVHPTSVKLDVIGLHRKMIELFNLFKRLDLEIKNVIINNEYDVDLINHIKQIYSKYREKISKISTTLNELASKEHCEQNSLAPFEFIERFLSDNHHNKELEDSILKMPTENAFILGLLIQAGKNIVDGNYKLAINDEQKNDFYKLLEITLLECDSFISLDGSYSNRDTCYSIFEKGYNVTSKWLNTSLSKIESCIDNEE